MDRLRRLLPYLLRYRWRLLLSLLGIALFTLLGVLPPLLLRYLVDHVISPDDWRLLPVIVAGILLLPLVGGAVRLVNMTLLVQTSRRFIADVRLAVFDKILHLSKHFHSEHAAGALVGRLMDDVNMVQTLISGNTMQILVDLIIVVFSVGAMLMISPGLSSLVLIMIALYLAAYSFFRRRIRTSSEKYRSLYDRVSGRLTETLEGVRHIRIYNREQSETAMFMERTSSSLARAYDTGLSSVGLSTACNAISGFGSAAIVGVAAYLVLTSPMTYGDLLAFSQYLWMTISPVVRLTTVVGELQQTFVSVDRVLELLESSDEIAPQSKQPAIRAEHGAVSFRKVRFAYPGAPPLFENFNLEIAAGQSVALVGPTGCGKSTLVSLLMRHWALDDGQILIDGVDVQAAKLETVRQIFGVVLQRPQLFDGTLADNIAYGRPQASREDIEAAARAAEVYDMAMALRDGFDTMIGTDGINLSLGEKQRVSIARAILKNPRILVMDEATSALDSQSEALVQRALGRALNGRTSFIIAHRLSTIVGADLIVVLDQGRIVERGRHEELLTIPGGMYRRLYEELQGAAEGHE